MFLSWLCRTASWVKSSYLCGDNYTLHKGDCPAGETALVINQRLVHTELTLDSPLHAAAASISITQGKTFTICSIHLTPFSIYYYTNYYTYTYTYYYAYYYTYSYYYTYTFYYTFTYYYTYTH